MLFTCQEKCVGTTVENLFTHPFTSTSYFVYIRYSFIHLIFPLPPSCLGYIFSHQPSFSFRNLAPNYLIASSVCPKYGRRYNIVTGLINQSSDNQDLGLDNWESTILSNTSDIRKNKKSVKNTYLEKLYFYQNVKQKHFKILLSPYRNMYYIFIHYTIAQEPIFARTT